MMRLSLAIGPPDFFASNYSRFLYNKIPAGFAAGSPFSRLRFALSLSLPSEKRRVVSFGYRVPEFIDPPGSYASALR